MVHTCTYFVFLYNFQIFLQLELGKNNCGATFVQGVAKYWRNSKNVVQWKRPHQDITVCGIFYVRMTKNIQSESIAWKNNQHSFFLSKQLSLCHVWQQTTWDLEVESLVWRYLQTRPLFCRQIQILKQKLKCAQLSLHFKLSLQMFSVKWNQESHMEHFRDIKIYFDWLLKKKKKDFTKLGM